jgi:hypothetical protein
MCDRTNGTFIDCPIVDFDLSEGKETFITIHNPSSVLMKMAQVSVPTGKFIAQQFKQETLSWEDLKSDIFCNNVELWNSNATENCQLFMEINIFPKDIQLLKINSINDDKSVKSQALKQGDMIETKDLALRFDKAIKDES